MSYSSSSDEEDEGEVFIDPGDVIRVIAVNDEDLPDADDAEAGEEAKGLVDVFCLHTGELFSVACSPTDTSLVATGGRDDRGFLWKWGQGSEAFELQGHQETVSSLAFSMDGELLASGSNDGLVQIWDINAKSLKGPLECSGEIEWLRWHPKGHILLAGCVDATVWMWNADSGAYLNMFSGHADRVTCGDFTPDGKTICTGSSDGTLRIWNPGSGENIHVVRGYQYHTGGLTCLAINSNSTLALTGSTDGSVDVVNITTGKIVSSVKDHTKSVQCIGFAASFPLAATGGKDGRVIIWDMQHSLVVRNICEHQGGVTCLSWLGASRYLATGGRDGNVRIWDSLSGHCVRTFSGHCKTIEAVAVSANAETLVSVSRDGTARVFEIAEFR